jgi:hypothetical protein
MRPGRLSFVKDPSVAGWIAPRLGPFGGQVGSVVPRGFPAYARVLHPAYDHDGEPVTWSSVCRKTGRVAHPLMQWQSIGGPGVEDGTGISAAGGMPWDGHEPLVGELEPQALSALCRLLAGHTGADVDCYFALWEGWGWIPGGESVAVLRSSSGRSLRRNRQSQPAPPAFSEEVMSGGRLHHPWRDYILFSGPLEAATDLGHWPSRDWFVPQSPNLIWPVGNSWCLATEVDFDSTLIAGGRDLIDAVLGAPDLEAMPVEPDDRLDSGGDAVNF